MGNRSFGGKLVFQLPWQLLWRVTQRQLGPGTTAVRGPRLGSQGGEGSPDGGARLGLSFALHPPSHLPPGVFYSHSLAASTQSLLPVAETGECRGVSCSLIKSHEKKYHSVSREEIPPQFGEKSKAPLPAETQILHPRKPNPDLISSFSILQFLLHNIKQINNLKVGALLVHCKTLSTKEEDHIRWR